MLKTCSWVNIPVSHSGHGNDAVVDGRGDGGEARVVVRVRLNVIAETTNQETGDAHQEDQQTKLLVTVLQSVGDGLQARRVTS